MEGAFQTTREIFEHPIWKNILEFRLFFLIYGQAVFSDEGITYGNMRLKRGQWLRSYRNLQKDLEYEENNSVKTYGLATLKRAISKLEQEGRITTTTTELGTLFTVLNYEQYQGLQNYKKQGLEQQRNSSGTAAEQQRNNNNKDNKDNKDLLTTPAEKAVLDELLQVKNFPDEPEKNLELLRKLATDFPNLNILQEAKRWRAYKLDKPLEKNSRPRSQFYKWCEIDAKKGGQPTNDRKGSPAQKDYAGKYAEFVR